MGESALGGDRIVALNKDWQALEQEGGLADIICEYCDMCNAPSQVGIITLRAKLRSVL